MQYGRSVRFVIAGNPRSKERARHRVVNTKAGGQFVATYTPQRTEDEEEVIRYVAIKAVDGAPLMTGAIRLQMCFYRRIPTSFSKRDHALALGDQLLPITKPDFDNYAKLVDACKGVVWVDDAQITDAHIYKRYSDQPRVVIEATEIVTAKDRPDGKIGTTRDGLFAELPA